MELKKLVQSYYDSLNKKDDVWKDLYSDDASFSDASGILNALGKEAVINSFTQFLKGVASVEVKELIAEGERVCAIVHYSYSNPKGETMSQDDAEVWTIQDGKLQKLVIYFDLTAYRNFMRG